MLAQVADAPQDCLFGLMRPDVLPVFGNPIAILRLSNLIRFGRFYASSLAKPLAGGLTLLLRHRGQQQPDAAEPKCFIEW